MTPTYRLSRLNAQSTMNAKKNANAAGFASRLGCWSISVASRPSKSNCPYPSSVDATNSDTSALGRLSKLR